MGGKAIEGAQRFTKEEYPFVIDDLERILHEMELPLFEYNIIKSYRNKPDFGDIDVIVRKSYQDLNKKLLESEITDYTNLIVKNNDVWSVGLKLYNSIYESSQKLIQVDFIFVDNLEVAADYFAWNDLGNLIGRIAHKLGFKYGHEGLKYVFRDGTHQYGEEIVSDNTEDILTFLGYSYSRFKEGFEDLEDIFNFVTTSPHFNSDIYLLDNRNNVSRTRDRKRKTYMEFLKWLDNKDFSESNLFPLHKELRHQVHLYRALACFPKFEERYLEVQEKHLKDKMFKQWWNGDIAREITGLEGKELGKFMQEMKVVYNLKECFDKSLDSRELAKILWNSNFVRN